ncbi:hypothetical protein Tco_0170256 [Tanacetum coccineum]
MNDSMTELRETFQVWLQQRQKQVVNLDSYTPETSQCRKIPIYYDDDNDKESSIPLRDIIISELPPCIAITPVLLTEEPVDSLIMEDKHLDTISATESEELIKFSVEDLVLIPSESEGIPNNMCDVPFRDNSSPLDISKDQFEDFSDSNDDSTSIDDDSFSIDNIDYVEVSPPHSELVSLEEVKDFHLEDGELKDDVLREKLSKINLLIAKIEALKDNPTPSSDFVTKSPSTSPNYFLEETNISYNSLPESETFCFHLEEKSSGNPTSYTDLSLPDYEAFFGDNEPDSGGFHYGFFCDQKNSGSTTIHADIYLSDLECFYCKSEPDLDDHTKETSSGSTTTHADISLPEYDSFHLDSEPDSGDFTMDVVEDIFDIQQRTKSSRAKYTLFPVIDTLLLVSSENVGQSCKSLVILALASEGTFLSGMFRSPFISLDQLKYGGSSQAQDSVNKNKRFDCPDFEASRARGFVLRSLELQILSFIIRIQYPNLID